MDKKLINKQLKLAVKAENAMHNACGGIASDLQPYFDYDISVFHQEGDGFVVMWDEDDNNAPISETVENVVETIEKDPDHYRIIEHQNQ